MIAALLLTLPFQVAAHAGALTRAASVTSPGTVHGSVRSDATGAPIAGARIESRESGRSATAISDLLGRFELRGIPFGAHRLRFAARGYDPLTVDVLLDGDVPLRIDVALSPAPEPLAPVRVLARTGAIPDGRARPGAEAGSWRISGDALRGSPALDDADPLQLLATAPQAQMLPESQAAVHVRGGSADQNRFLLDGAPVYSPVHAGPVPSVFSPDIVDALVVHGGAPPARYGGALSSVVDVRTPSGVPEVASVRGAFGPNSLRGAISLPILDERAGLLISVRNSYDGMRREDVAELAMPGTWSDLYGKLTLRLGDDDVTLASFTSENGLGFPAIAVDEPGRPRDRAERNLFDWTSTTHGLAWRHPLGAGGSVETRAWSARFDGAVDWRSDSAGVALHSTLRDAGLSTMVVRPHARGTLAAGAEVRRLAERYDLAPGAASGRVDEVEGWLLRLNAAPAIGSVFVEEVWRPAGAWTLGAGVRATWTSRTAPRVEPRLSAAFEPSTHLALSFGYARLHQYDQSLGNEESVLGTVVAPDFLVAARSGGVPVASSDELAATAAVALGARTRLVIDSYARRLRGLVLVAPATSAPFAMRGFAVGSGAAWGAGLSIDRRLNRLMLQGSYALGTVTRRAGDVLYHPAFAPSQTASLALGYRLRERTAWRTALWAASGRPTTPLADNVGWDARDAFTGARELSGTPEHTAGALNGTRLPDFVRLDVGLRHTLAVWRGRGALTGSASVSDALGRKNVAGYVAAPAGGARRPLVMLPPSLRLGLAWGY